MKAPTSTANSTVENLYICIRKKNNKIGRSHKLSGVLETIHMDYYTVLSSILGKFVAARLLYWLKARSPKY